MAAITIVSGTLESAHPIHKSLGLWPFAKSLKKSGPISCSTYERHSELPLNMRWGVDCMARAGKVFLLRGWVPWMSKLTGDEGDGR